MKYGRIEVKTTSDLKDHVSRWVKKSKRYTTVSDLIKKLLIEKTEYKES